MSLQSFQLFADKPIPKHIAIIMDGNRRWYKKNCTQLKLKNAHGHFYGAKVLPNILKTALDLRVQTMTLFAFSTENIKRPQKEVHELFALLRYQLLQQTSFLKKHSIRLRFIGNLSVLPKDLYDQIFVAAEETATYNRLELVIAINYGGRDEILRAVKKISIDLLRQKISLDDLSEQLMDTYLDTCGIPAPDLLIRTGGEMRVSNFLLWQIAYTELYVTDILWPDFQPQHLIEAIRSYQLRSIRKGK